MQAFWMDASALFIALDLPGNLPLFLMMTRSLPSPERRRLTHLAMIVASLTAAVFVIAGQAVLHVLRISPVDMRISGGIILLLLALVDLVLGTSGGIKHRKVGVVPLAVPLVTGPAVMTTLLVLVERSGIWITCLNLTLNYLLCWASLLKAQSLAEKLGSEGLEIGSKIAHLFLAAIAVSMIRSGIVEVFQKL